MSNAERDLHGGLDDSVDPVCGMKVATDTDKRYIHKDETYLFCSASCLGKFQADADRYLNPDRKRLRHPPRGLRYRVIRGILSTPAPCTRRSGTRGPDHARSAAWRLSPKS